MAESIPIQNIDIALLDERPELFQFRDTDYKKGKARPVSDVRVKQLVAAWNPERLDPISVVANPDAPGRFIVLGGHHRIAAMRELDINQSPIRVLKGNLSSDVDRRRLVREAILTNYGIADNNIREQALAANALHEMGMDLGEIKAEMRLKSPTRAEHLLWLHSAGPAIIERTLIQPELEPAAIELGRAGVKYGMPYETRGALFSRWLEEYEDTGNVPGQVSLRTQIDALAQARGDRGNYEQKAGMLEGFGGDVVLAEFDKSRRELELLAEKEQGLGNRMSACAALADELGIDLGELMIKAEERRLAVEEARLLEQDKMRQIAQGKVEIRPIEAQVLEVRPTEHTPQADLSVQVINAQPLSVPPSEGQRQPEQRNMAVKPAKPQRTAPKRSVTRKSKRHPFLSKAEARRK